MTIEQILNGTNSVPTDELKNRFLEKTIRSEIQGRMSSAPSDFLNQIENAIMKIADGTIVRNYCHPVAVGEVDSSVQLELSEQDKADLIKSLRKVCEDQLENYKNNLDYIFGNSSKPSEQQPAEKKVEIEIKPEAAASVVTKPNYFEY